MFEKNYKPDILNCMANLSNDEVFTNPTLVNLMLDMLPQELFESKETTFLDPSCKTGVFLREITKRLLKGQIKNYEAKLNKLNEDRESIRLIINEGNYGRKEIDIDDLINDEYPESKVFLNELQLAINHIMTKQVFGIAITELTALMSRRTLYCSKDSNAKYSIVEGEFGMDTRPSKSPSGEIIDNVCNIGHIIYEKLEHDWGKADKKGNCTCKACGANSETLKRDDGLETYAYPFIHWSIDELERRLNMGNFHIDVIAANPPYQLNLGNTGGNSAKAQAIYHKFIDQAKRLNPKYILMITPSRWMTRTQAGVPDSWVDGMLQGNHFKEIHDFDDASQCFPGVEIKGGVNYFLYDERYTGKCKYTYHDSKNNSIDEHIDYLDKYNSGIVIRDPKSNIILEKIIAVEGAYYANEKTNFSNYVSPADFFTQKPLLTSNWNGYVDIRDDEHPIKYYLNKSIHKKEFGWVSEDIIPKNKKSININKVYIPAAGGSGNDSRILGKPFFGESGSICSQTYRVIGYNPEEHNLTQEECLNIISYIKTRFFRYLVSIKKITQNGARGVYQFVPLQDFSKPWTDAELYKKYKLTQEEIDFIEANIQEMK